MVSTFNISIKWRFYQGLGSVLAFPMTDQSKIQDTSIEIHLTPQSVETRAVFEW